ncbi:hypothetical protein J2W91_004042 [Paenibacillus amylolyticus]|uniref:Uncharacterized protein n=2 Tax=Paenibacillus amylolyticus TaxID=1451 RepID=A0AAP5H3B7_PAEAM|nr:hypothetical protein [Paenibacillus amylolyticus]
MGHFYQKAHPKLTMIEAKTSEWGSFSYSTNQKLGGEGYFENMLKNKDSRYSDFNERYEKLLKENPGLEFEYVRVETDISKTKVGFEVDIVKVKDWSKALK